MSFSSLNSALHPWPHYVVISLVGFVIVGLVGIHYNRVLNGMIYRLEEIENRLNKLLEQMDDDDDNYDQNPYD